MGKMVTDSYPGAGDGDGNEDYFGDDGVDDAGGLGDVSDLGDAHDADGADADLQGRCWGGVPCFALCGCGVKTRVSSKASLHQPFDSPTNAHRSGVE